MKSPLPRKVTQEGSSRVTKGAPLTLGKKGRTEGGGKGREGEGGSGKKGGKRRGEKKGGREGWSEE